MRALERIRTASAVAALVFLALLVLSGWALMTGYVPSDDEAFASTLYLRQQGGLGASLQALHHHLASAIVVAGFLYLLATWLAGRTEERPGDWWLALGAFLLLLGINFVGYLLPMDQDAYWGTVVRLGIVETIPLAGGVIAGLLRGGGTLNAATLPRFHALHTAVLPTLLALPVVLLIAAARRRSPVGEASRARRWLIFALLVTVAAWGLAAALPAPLELGHDPVDTEYAPRPEWYFMWLFQLGKYVESVPWVESLALPVLGIGLLMLLPLVPAPGRRARWTLGMGWCAVWLLLTGLAYRADRDLPPRLPYEQAIHARATDWYVDLCCECHGDGGAGDGPESRTFDYETPDLTRAEVWEESSAIEMIRAVASGKGDDMPAFGRKLDERDIVALIEFMRAEFLENGARVPIPEESDEDA
jgi:ubiquinol-cytochrome c reductase cytochrome b subunit